MNAEPPVRPDGLCAVCLAPRRPERSRRYAGIQAEFDPFCSSTCARHWHGNPLPEKSIWGEPRNEDAA